MTRLEIVPWREGWSAEFREVAAALRRGLGPLALRIDHIGSTAVPGLAAKDVLDVQVTTAALEDAVQVACAGLGYIRHAGVGRDHCPPGAPDAEGEWDKWLFRAPADRRRTNIHVRVEGRANQRYPLLFRDYLRSHAATAAAYAELKLRLARHLADPETYPDVKDPAVDLIYLAAEEWARAAAWRPGPSDG